MDFNFLKQKEELSDPILDTAQAAPETCTHVWNIFAKTFAAPKTSIQLTDLPSQVLERLLFGVTTYMWECIECGNIRKIETLGIDDNPLDAVLQKALNGIQYVDFNGRKFAIALVPQEEQNISVR